MKANEAPEKVYLQEPTKVRTEKKYDNDVEYIRTEAFIEKARKWFEKRDEWRDINGIKHCDMEDFEDFKKYMKGEKVWKKK